MKELNSKQEKIVNDILDLMESIGFLRGIDLLDKQLDEMVAEKTISEEEAEDIARYILQTFMGIFGGKNN